MSSAERDVETRIGHLKTTMKMDVLRCKTEEGVRKEMTVFALVYGSTVFDPDFGELSRAEAQTRRELAEFNPVQTVMLEAARRQGVPASRISFAETYKWMPHARPGDTLPPLIINPYRPERMEPRCKKRRPKQYDLMNKPRAELRKALQNKRKQA